MWRTSLLDLDRLKTPSSVKKTNYALELPLLNNFDRQADRAMYSEQILKIEDRSFLQPGRVKPMRQRGVGWLSVYLPPIDVNSSPLLVWNILLLLMIAYNFIQIPIVVLIINYAYSDPYYTFEFIYVDIGILIYLLLDMLLVRWRICFFEKQRKIKHPIDIFYRYWKQYFIYDAISFAAYLIFVCVRNIAYIKLLFFFKFGSLASVTTPIRHKIEFKLFAWSLYKFIRLMFFIYFVVSLGACIYFAIDYHYYLEQGFYFDNGLLWLTGSSTTDYLNLVAEFQWQVWYEYAVYLLIQCIRGCGYGDMTGRNPPEILFNNLLMLFNLWMFSYFAEGILNIVKKFKKDTIKIQEQYAILNNFCEIHEVEETTKKKSKVFIQSKRLKLNDEEQNRICRPLSEKLKIDFYLTFHRQFCDNLPILDTLFKHEDHSWTGFAKDMIMHLKTRYLYPGEVITEAKKHNDLIVALIVRGRVKVSNAISQYEKKYTEWQYIGQTEFFLGGLTVNRAVCKTHTKIYYYQHDLFFRVLRRHAEEKEKFCYFHDAVKIDRKEGRCFELNCCICQGPHLEEYCQRNQLFNSDALKRYLVTYQRSDIQKRTSYNRKMSLLSRSLLKPQIKVDSQPKFQLDSYKSFQFYCPEYNL